MKKIKSTNKCIYCKEQKIHPAFKKDNLCGTCASNCFEDYQERVAVYKKQKIALVVSNG